MGVPQELDVFFFKWQNPINIDDLGVPMGTPILGNLHIKTADTCFRKLSETYTEGCVLQIRMKQTNKNPYHWGSLGVVYAKMKQCTW